MTLLEQLQNGLDLAELSWWTTFANTVCEWHKNFDILEYLTWDAQMNVHDLQMTLLGAYNEGIYDFE